VRCFEYLTDFAAFAGILVSGCDRLFDDRLGWFDWLLCGQ